MRLWVDAHRPVIQLEIEGNQPIEATASIEMWRTNQDTLPSLEVSDVLYDRVDANGQRVPTIVEPDSILTRQVKYIGWYHHNGKSVGPALTAQIQGLTGFTRVDPLLGRTFGALISARHGERLDDSHLRSSLSKRHRFTVCVLTKHPASSGEWLKAINALMRKTQRIPLEPMRKEHAHWWAEFWNRSWIRATSEAGEDTTDRDDAYVVSRAYALQRFINACAGRGQFPIKFNGSIFTVPFAGRPGNADYRQWGPGYWWQNTRLPYVSMCASGDFDLMNPLFRMYGKDLMPLFRYRTRHYLQHGGAFIPECIYFWGDVFSQTYGWTPFENRSDKLQESRWHKWEWVSGLELVSMMLEYYEFTLDERFLREMALPVAHEILTFFDEQYNVDAKGKLVMFPSQACETWWDCTNPMPEIAGLHAAVNHLLLLPERLTTTGQRKFWSDLKKKLPDLPTRVLGATTMLAPAERFERKQNSENPELYAVFPFRLIAFDSPNRNLALEAFAHREDRGNAGWRQDDIFAAYLGLVDTARESIVARARNKNADSRFPAFWGPNYDWIPDQDHGSVLLKTLQAMVMQYDEKHIYILPSWPENWNVEFKLRAPRQTIVEGRYVDGMLKDLRVSPPGRKKDVVYQKSN